EGERLFEEIAGARAVRLRGAHAEIGGDAYEAPNVAADDAAQSLAEGEDVRERSAELPRSRERTVERRRARRIVFACARAADEHVEDRARCAIDPAKVFERGVALVGQ